jgi:hypothetical protein
MPEQCRIQCVAKAESAHRGEAFLTNHNQDSIVTSDLLEKALQALPRASPTLLRLPGEVRNLLYVWCVLFEASKVRTIRYNSPPLRRSRRYGKSNFQGSLWSFTQTNRQIRGELLPWLLKDRRVRTPLATINDYIEVFHPVDPATGCRTGWVEAMPPKACIVLLHLRGVEVFSLLKHNHTDAGFHLHFPAQYPHANPQRRDEVDLLHQLSRRTKLAGHVFKTTGITSIKVLPFIETPLEHHLDISRSNANPSLKHTAMVKFDTVPTHAANGLLRTIAQQRYCLMYWLIFEVRLAHNTDLRIQARLRGYEVMWEVFGLSVMAGTWERCDDARGVVFRKYLLAGQVRKLPDRSDEYRVVELQLPQQP